MGFRLAPGGAQEYFGVSADMVTYGKTRRRRPAGGRALRPPRFMQPLPRGPAGRRLLRAGHVQLAPLCHGGDVRVPAASRGAGARAVPRARRAVGFARGDAQRTPAGGRLARAGRELLDIWTICYAQPSRYNWMFQYYLREEGLALSWVGTGWLIFSLNYTEADSPRSPTASSRRPGDAAGRLVVGRTRTSPTSPIKRRVLREMLQARSVPVLSGSMSSPRSR